MPFSLLKSGIGVRRRHTSLISVTSICFSVHAIRGNCCVTSEKSHESLLHLHFVLHCSPAPYEICPEDYAVSMVWRRTPSGELAFNRCPPNATGTDMSNDFHLLLVFCYILAYFLNSVHFKAHTSSLPYCLALNEMSDIYDPSYRLKVVH